MLSRKIDPLLYSPPVPSSHTTPLPPLLQECRKRTVSWVRARRGMEMSPMRSIEGGSGAADIELLGEGGALCSFYERLDEQGTDAVLGPGVYTLEELKELGRLKGWCSGGGTPPPPPKCTRARPSTTLRSLLLV